jgi:hypothetical protein
MNFLKVNQVALFVVCFVAAGCGVGPAAAGSKMTGHVHGGQQPVSGSKVYLYAVSPEDGGSARSLLKAPGYVTTGRDGSFNIDNDYSCATGDEVYLLALGGNPGLSGDPDNLKIALASAAGPCSALNANSVFTINEVTTVAMAFSFSAYATSGTQVGSSSKPAITAAFNEFMELVSPSEGSAFQFSPSGNAAIPQQKVNSLANSLAACVNSGGEGTGCSLLIQYATVNGKVPGDTFQAALNIASSPATDVADLYDLSSADVVFQPALTSVPMSWSIAPQPLTFYPNVPPAPPAFTPPAMTGAQKTCVATCAFFDDEQAFGTNGVEFLQFPNGNFFGYFSLVTGNESIIYHYDMQYESVIDAADGLDGVLLYDFPTQHYFYTNPSLFPYLYDYTLTATLYYYPDPNNQGHYNYNTTTLKRDFWDFGTGAVIAQ